VRLRHGKPRLAFSKVCTRWQTDRSIRERGSAEIYLGSLQGEFRQKGIQARFLVAEGSVVKTIINVAEREGVDLIAMASHGRTGLARVFYGSVAAGVLHQVDRPLLLIRADSGE
jgi:nucleotide-binding universal stress UspA family protein